MRMPPPSTNALQAPACLTVYTCACDEYDCVLVYDHSTEPLRMTRIRHPHMIAYQSLTEQSSGIDSVHAGACLAPHHFPAATPYRQHARCMQLQDTLHACSFTSAPVPHACRCTSTTPSPTLSRRSYTNSIQRSLTNYDAAPARIATIGGHQVERHTRMLYSMQEEPTAQHTCASHEEHTQHATAGRRRT